MGEVLVRFTEPVRDENGASYTAQACGAVDSDGLWQGWVEFAGASGSAFRSPRETKQPNRDALVYWAEGLTVAYLEGALRRALDALIDPPARVASAEPSIFTGPVSTERVPVAPRRPHPILDPLATFAQGEEVLRQQLSALSRDHLEALIDAYALPISDDHSASERELVDGIVRAVHRLANAG